MLVLRLTIAVAVLGLSGSPVASLFCPSDDTAAMACCQRDANDCNQRGKSDDCCRTVPADGQTLAVAAKARDLAKPPLTAAPAAVMPTLAFAAAPPRLALGVRASDISVGFFPPRLSVLRL
jgi:hypothetical protein